MMNLTLDQSQVWAPGPGPMSTSRTLTVLACHGCNCWHSVSSQASTNFLFFLAYNHPVLHFPRNKAKSHISRVFHSKISNSYKMASRPKTLVKRTFFVNLKKFRSGNSSYYIYPIHVKVVKSKLPDIASASSQCGTVRDKQCTRGQAGTSGA